MFRRQRDRTRKLKEGGEQERHRSLTSPGWWWCLMGGETSTVRDGKCEVKKDMEERGKGRDKFRHNGAGGGKKGGKKRNPQAEGRPPPPAFFSLPSLWISFSCSSCLAPSLLGCFSVFCSLAPSLFLHLLRPHLAVPPLACRAPSVCLTLLSCPVCVCGSLSRPFLCAIPAAGEE